MAFEVSESLQVTLSTLGVSVCTKTDKKLKESSLSTLLQSIGIYWPKHWSNWQIRTYNISHIVGESIKYHFYNEMCLSNFLTKRKLITNFTKINTKLQPKQLNFVASNDTWQTTLPHYFLSNLFLLKITVNRIARFGGISMTKWETKTFWKKTV